MGETVIPLIPDALARLPNTLRVIVFDMDGVLIHSAPCHRQAFVDVLQPLGINSFEYSRFAGWRTREVIEFVLAEAGIAAPESLIAETAAEKSRRAREILEAAEPLAQGCVEVLCELDRAGFVIALASSGSTESVGAFLAATRTSSLFRSVLTGNDVRLAKPDPEIYSRTFECLGVLPEQGLIVEDAVAGVRAARAAGSRAVAVEGTCRPEDLRAAGALDVLSGIAALPAWLTRQGVCPVPGKGLKS